MSVPDREALIQQLAYLSESPPIHEQFTARQRLEYNGLLRGMISHRVESLIETLLDRFDLAEDAEACIVTCFHGMHQKPGLIKTIIH